MNKHTIKINITTKWDNYSGNIVYKRNKDTFDIKISKEFDKLDVIDKLDYLSDLSTWVQYKVNEVHNILDPKESSLLVDHLRVISPTERK
jgi:hypothetical protein